MLTEWLLCARYNFVFAKRILVLLTIPEISDLNTQEEHVAHRSSGGGGNGGDGNCLSMKSFRNCWTEVLPSLACTYQNGLVVEKSIGWTMLQVLKGLDLKVSKTSHIALNVMKRGRDEKQSSCDCSHSFYIMSFLDLHSKIWSLKFYTEGFMRRAWGVGSIVTQWQSLRHMKEWANEGLKSGTRLSGWLLF